MAEQHINDHQDRVSENNQQGSANDHFDRQDLYKGLPDLAKHGQGDSAQGISGDGQFLHCGGHDHLYGGDTSGVTAATASGGDSTANSANTTTNDLASLTATVQDLQKALTDIQSGNDSTAITDLSQALLDMQGNSSAATNSSSSLPPASTDAGTTTASTGATAGGSDATKATGTDTGATSGDAAPLTVAQVNSQQDASQNPVLPSGGVQDYGYGWAKGASGQWPTPGMPATANASVDWLIAYPTSGTAENPDSKITVNNLNEYALMKDGTWDKLSTTQDGNTWGQINPNNMQGITSSDIPTTVNSDGSFTMATAPDGQVDQIGAPGGSFDNSQIVGIYESAQVKADSNDSNTAVQLGSDWYHADASANGVPTEGLTYLEGIGTSNWVNLTDQYQSIAFTNIDAATLANNPPPGVSG